VLRRIFVPETDDIVRGWRKLYNVELHNLYSSSNVIRMVKSKRMRRAGQVTSMRKTVMHRDFGGKSRGKETTRKA
jgi:hypothetical protein